MAGNQPPAGEGGTMIRRGVRDGREAKHENLGGGKDHALRCRMVWKEKKTINHDKVEEQNTSPDGIKMR
jgi:hypothetical protein